MSKTKVIYICSQCGFESIRWLGKCPECENWNTFSEELVESGKKKTGAAKLEPLLNTILEITAQEEDRIKTNTGEFDRVLGGGLMPGSVVLIGGDPGIGKSTLVMQGIAGVKKTTLYVTGEESLKQIKLRASRLKVDASNFYVLAETNLSAIEEVIKKVNPSVVVIDSIQTMYRDDFDNSPGTVTQIRESTAMLMEIAKKNNFAVLLVGHVTKEGMIAGPKVLEHIVDTVLQLEGDKHHQYRILRAQKNRFGSTNEIGIFEMHEDGLTEVANPSEIFLGERERNNSGSVITSSMEGTRPILLEVQALVTPSHYGNPQRVATGFDYRRLSILLAVLEKRGGYRLSAANVFLNMVGGVKIFEPAVDLAVCCSIASSLLDKIADNSTVVIGEVGLGGEIRSVGHIEKRIQEAEKLGFKKVVIPKSNYKGLNIKKNVELITVENLTDAIQSVLKG
jgi:DNA repair protein RadA/Sms